MPHPSQKGAKEEDTEENAGGSEEGNQQSKGLLSRVDAHAHGQDSAAYNLQGPPLELAKRGYLH